ncbi:ABC transporter permease [Puia dinghuensis]|uniref:ABC transporter permease n=1 Tax=Puia dinghuensis TaxID=1792502 RepID=A0A8J2UHK1_9BACT|nr:ABC transporter permease [Puia dinghuensis]GGB19238.1 ABC transporter permease [Puia dinghuensis]
MLRSYLIVAWRNLFRNRTFSIINLFGLSVSVAFCLLLFYHIRWEQSFDTFHQKKDRLYRCEMSGLGKQSESKDRKGVFDLLLGNNDQENDLAFPLIVGPDLRRNFPEVAAYNRIMFHWPGLVGAGPDVYKESEIVWTDANFFQTFSFPLLKGDARTALASPNNVVLAESVAKKYFGNKDPMGQTVRLLEDSTRLFRVTGVAADAPANSSIQFGLVFPIEAEHDYRERLEAGFNQMSYDLLVELQPGTDRHKFEGKMNAWVKTYIRPFLDTIWFKGVPAEVRDSYHWNLRPLADCHYNAAAWGHYTDAKAIYQLFCIVVVIVLLASLNYVLITVSNAAARSQEVGVRKVMGAGRRAIILQSWVETQLLAGIAVGFGLMLSWLGLPLLRSVIGSEVSFGALSWKEVVAAALVLAVALGLLAGYYPALLISRLKPLSIMKGFSSVRINPRFSRVLVVVQFTCCVVLMTAAFVIDRQMVFVMNKDLGFDKDQVLIVHNPTYDGAFVRKTRDALYAFARSRPDVLAYSSMNGGPTGASNTNSIILNGKQGWYRMITVDYNYFELLKLKFVQGRGFSPAFLSDTSTTMRPVVVNETMLKMLGKDARLGVYNKDMRGTIIGVVKDYNFESLTKKIEPEQHRLLTTYCADFLFKIRAGQVASTISAFETEWKRVTNGYPFSYDFLDASLAKRYEADMRWQRAMKAASFFAIVIACMGLFGLSAIAAANRTKEIGIRKVLGASVRDLVAMLASGFLSLVVLSIAIAMPLAWWIMNRWLEDFAYRIDIRWWMFGVVGVMAMLIALATVSFQVLKAARANPVVALRSE